MKTILFFDTETTGLVEFSKPSEDPCQPRITQLAAELCVEETGETLSGMNFIIKPDGWTIPEELQKLTGITMERANLVGVPMEHVMHTFIEMWLKCDIRCAHNESFDMRMIRIEIMRHCYYSADVVEKDGGLSLAFADFWKNSAAFCTQSNSTKILNLPPTEKMIAAGRRHAKSPNLAEAYKHFTGKDLEGAHNAAVDIMACKAVYYGIKKAKA